MEQDYTQITLDEWMQWKEDIRVKLKETAQNFVYIGYRLKQIRDSKRLDGAADIFEFAQKEYGLGKSTVSRFIAINEKFSEGGNSIELKEEYKNFTSSKLSEMLTLPDNECQLITENTTIKEIRELKNFSRQTIHFASDGSEIEYTPLQKCIIDYFKDKKEVLNRVITIIMNPYAEIKETAELINPVEQTSHKKGIIFLFMYSWNDGVKYKDLRYPEPISLSWEQFLDEIIEIYGGCDRENVHKSFYGEQIEAEIVQEEPKSVQNDTKSVPEESKIETETSEEEKEKTEEPKVEQTSINQGFESCCDVATEEEKVADEETENELGEDTTAEISSELSESECESATKDSECSTESIDDDTNSEPEGSKNRTMAAGLEKEVIEKTDYIYKMMLRDNDTPAKWRKIKHSLNNLNGYIEQIIRYLDLAEEEESEEE